MNSETLMHNRGRLTAIAAGLFAGALVLSGCGSDSGTSSGKLTWEDSPLAQYTMGDWDPNETDEEREAKYAEEERQVQEVIAECMTKEGFEYTPHTSSFFGYSSDDLDVDYESREYAEKYGYGAFTDPWGNYDEEKQKRMQEEYEEQVGEDPNATYIESLSESEREAYYAALYGGGMNELPPGYSEGDDIPQEAWDEYFENYVYDWTKNGCQGQADHEVRGDMGMGMGSGEFDDLYARMATVYEDSMTDPRLKTLDSSWASCMADAGFSGLTDPNSAQQVYWEKFNELQNAFWETMPQPSEEQLNDPNFDWEAFYENQPKFNMNTPEIQAEAEQEVKQATADWDCKKKLNYSDEQLKVQFEYEQKFVDQNKAELEAMKASQEQGKN